MSIVLYDPVFDVEVLTRRAETLLDTLKGKRVGYIFNQHTSALAFWKAFESEIERVLAPASSHRVYKTNTWASAPKAKTDELISATDYALVGVGA